MVKFAYNNMQNSGIDYILFEFNNGYNLIMLFEDESEPHLRSCSINKLAKELRKLIEICY